MLYVYGTDIQGMRGLITRETTYNAFRGLREVFRGFGINDEHGLSRFTTDSVQPNEYLPPEAQEHILDRAAVAVGAVSIYVGVAENMYFKQRFRFFLFQRLYNRVVVRSAMGSQSHPNRMTDTSASMVAHRQTTWFAKYVVAVVATLAEVLWLRYSGDEQS